jgi:ubiquinone/menaquinone biosynthesis C-methylase UbiE
MGQGIGVTQWDPLIQEILRILKPGGWVEVVEVDLELHRTGPMTRVYNDRLLTLMAARHLDPHGGRRLKDRFEARDDLMNINTTFISCPGGQWAGKVNINEGWWKES